MRMSSTEYERLRREVEDRMLTWKCRVENPPRQPLPSSNSTPNIAQLPPTSSTTLQQKLPKIFSFENASGGAGAPRRTPSGRLQTFLRGDPEIRFHQRDSSIFERSIRYQLDKDAIQKYRADLDQQVATKNAYSVLRRWESLPKLNSTDVTRSFVMSPTAPDQAEYKRDLEQQLETKRRLEEQLASHDKYLSKLHFSAFDNFWGKPGGGAPRSSKRKENLFKLLHSTR